MNRYFGNLVKSDIKDKKADILAKRLNGQSSVYFDSDPIKREFDVISDEYIAQTKHTTKKIKPSFTRQVKATFEAAQQTGRKVYFHFEEHPAIIIIDRIKKMSEIFNVELIIDVSSL